MKLVSSSMAVTIRGSSPLFGDFTATVRVLSTAGKMRITPFMEHRMLLWSYVAPPDVSVQISVRAPLIGEQTVPLADRLAFIKTAFTAAIQDSLVEPRRAAYSLDVAYTVQAAVDTNVNIQVEEIMGLAAAPPPPEGNNGSSSSSAEGERGKEGGGKEGGGKEQQQRQQRRQLVAREVAVTAINMDTRLSRSSAAAQVDAGSGSAALRELIKVPLGSKSGAIKLQVRPQACSYCAAAATAAASAAVAACCCCRIRGG